MSGPWKTHRGDEWWYEGFSLRAYAVASADSVSIDEVAAVKGRLTPDDLHSFLCQAQAHFAGARIRVNLDVPGVEAWLQALQDKGCVTYEPMATGYSRHAKLTALSPLPARTRQVAKVPQKKRWLFW